MHARRLDRRGKTVKKANNAEEMKPEYDFKLYRIVVEYLVAKEQMKPEAIEIFIRSK